ncbi:MAG: LamB/YcsF family protein [Chloroflexota bacterium]|nr:LamB/YcsF family protein [Chloroflexota bacterium]
MRRVDLNCDMGESFGAWTIGQDEEMLRLVTSSNIACGFHAGDPAGIERTVRAALQQEVAVGAHPSYPDLQGFGRRSMQVATEELESLLLYQLAALAGIARANGGTMRHVKLHGALYNDAALNADLAGPAIRALQRLDSTLLLYALAGSALSRLARQAGLRVVEEAFADRRYTPEGRLQSRHVAGSLITDPEEAARQVEGILLQGRAPAYPSGETRLEAETICVHGDNPAALTIARLLRTRLATVGVEVRSPE